MVAAAATVITEDVRDQAESEKTLSRAQSVAAAFFAPSIEPNVFQFVVFSSKLRATTA